MAPSPPQYSERRLSEQSSKKPAKDGNSESSLYSGNRVAERPLPPPPKPTILEYIPPELTAAEKARMAALSAAGGWARAVSAATSNAQEAGYVSPQRPNNNEEDEDNPLLLKRRRKVSK